MSLKDSNVVNPTKTTIVLSNPAVSTTTGWPVGFWWSELTHPYYMLSLSPAVWTSVWKPDHINALWVRCHTCEKPNDVTDRHRQCINCGDELPPQPTYW